MLKSILIASFTLAVSFPAIGQFENINKKFGDYKFRTKHDTVNYMTSLRVYNDDKIIFKGNYEGYVTDVRWVDFNNDGRKVILFDAYSGGAHCCYTVYTGRISKDKFMLTDSLFLGNSYFTLGDLNKDGKTEMECSNDMFAYAFTNYAETRFPTMIYEYRNGKLVNTTSEFPDLIRKELSAFIEDLKSLTDSGFKCENAEEGTFNTEAGSVKTVLAAIVADYYTLGEVQKGYELVNSAYNCPDKNKFIGILQNEYKLK